MIRLATRADLDRICRTNMRAFAKDPLLRWLMPNDEAYTDGQCERLSRTVFLLWQETGEVWTTEDGVAVAAWGPPVANKASEALVAELGELRAGLPADVLGRTAILRSSFAEHHPSEPHWYLNVLATHPDWQRQGLGIAVMSDVRRRCDAEGLGQYLETATDEDVAYYRSRGFEVTEAWLVGGVVQVTGMWRNPGAGNPLS